MNYSLASNLVKKSTLTLAMLAALSLATTQAAEAGAIRRNLTPTQNTFSTLPGNDDGSTGEINMGFTANFFGQTYSSLFVNNNGNVTFNGPLYTYTPFGLNSTNTPIIAPFFGDVDTRPAASADVTYGRTTVDGRNAFAVNWDPVGYYYESTDKLNQFQLVMIDRSDTGAGNFDFEFNYDQIQWETGTASGGSNGLGGYSARVGFSHGTSAPGSFFELAGSAVNGAFLDSNHQTGLIYNSLNSSVDGRYVFFARNGAVTPTPVPEPSCVLGMLAFGALGAGSLRKSKQKSETLG